jgi:Right handed beta helix region
MKATTFLLTLIVSSVGQGELLAQTATGGSPSPDLIQGMQDAEALFAATNGAPTAGQSGSRQAGVGGGGLAPQVAAPAPAYATVSGALINVDFYSGGKQGPAAVGQGPSDYWNSFDDCGSYDTIANNLLLSDGSTGSGVGLEVQNAFGCWAFTCCMGSIDPMYDGYKYSTGSPVYITLSSLPDGAYDIYVYGHGPAQSASTVFTLGHTALGTGTNDDTWDTADWTEGSQYVVFRGVPVSGGQNIEITATAGPSGYVLLNGMQIVRTGNAYYVSPDGSDTNPGTAAAPFQTIAHALINRSYGDAIVLYRGYYRESVNVSSVLGDQSSLLNIENFDGQTPIVTGSEAVPCADWTAEAQPEIALGNQYSQLPISVNYSTYTMPKDWLTGQSDPAIMVYATPWPYASNPPQQAFYYPTSGDPVSLRQVGWSSTIPDWVYNADGTKHFDYRPALTNVLDRGTFFFLDEGGGEQWLYVRLPNDEIPWFEGHVEVSVRHSLLSVSVPMVRITGVTFEHSNVSASQLGAAGSIGQGDILDSCTVRDTDMNGLGAGSGTFLVNCHFLENGQLGAGPHGDCVMDNCVVEGNNTRRFSTGWAAGGIKIVNGVQGEGTTIENCEIATNYGPGIWSDGVATGVNTVITNNYIHDNPGGGIQLEISSGFLVCNNVLVNNNIFGVWIDASCSAQVLHNTIVTETTNAYGAIGLAVSGVAGDRIDVPMTGNLVENNALVTHNYQVLVVLQTQPSANIYDNLLDHNFYYADSGHLPLRLNMNSDSEVLETFFYNAPGRLTDWDEFGTNNWYGATGCDANSYQGVDPAFKDPAAPPDGYDLISSSPLIGGALFLSEVPIDYLGASRYDGTGECDIGAFEYSPGR